MPISFPTSPTVGQTFTISDRTWTWNGNTWDSASPITYAALNGANFTGAVSTSSTLTSSTGVIAPNIIGKNAIINGGFDFWQRGTSFTGPGNSAFIADRWVIGYDATPTSNSVTQQAFTPGNAIAGYEAPYFLRSTITTAGSNNVTDISNKIEDVRTFAGQTVTLSFWAKADSARTSLIYLTQIFGSGGSASVTFGVTSLNWTTSWQRYSVTISVPSISGKTIGSGSYLGVAIRQNGANGSVLDIWGVQLEAGLVATPFSRAGGTYQGELAACQRYFYRSGGTVAYQSHSQGVCASGTLYCDFVLPVPMRVSPTLTVNNLSGFGIADGVTSTVTPTSIYIQDAASTNNTHLQLWANATLTAGRAARLFSNNSTAATLDFSAEL